MKPRSHAEAFRYEGKKLLGVYTYPEGRRRCPGVLFLHGFPGSEKNVDIQRALLGRGIASFSLYFAGSWGSEGLYRVSTLVDQASAGLRRLASRPEVDSKRLGVFGFSMGGWTAIHLGARSRGLKGVAVVAPAGGKEMITPGLRSFVRRSSEVLRVGSAAAMFEDVVRTISRMDPAESAARLNCPLLLIHGMSDDVVPISVSTRIHAAANHGTTLLKVRGAEHDFLDRRAWLTRRVSSWLARRLK